MLQRGYIILIVGTSY